MLTRWQMIIEATRRIEAYEDPQAVIKQVFGPVLDAVAYAARKSRKLDEGECDSGELIVACYGCAEVIADDEE